MELVAPTTTAPTSADRDFEPYDDDASSRGVGVGGVEFLSFRDDEFARPWGAHVWIVGCFDL